MNVIHQELILGIVISFFCFHLFLHHLLENHCQLGDMAKNMLVLGHTIEIPLVGHKNVVLNFPTFIIINFYRIF
jgi:hypothetical protein